MSTAKILEVLSKQPGLMGFRYFEDGDRPTDGCGCLVGALAREMPPELFGPVFLEMSRFSEMSIHLIPKSADAIANHYGISTHELGRLQLISDKAEPQGQLEPSTEERLRYVLEYLTEEMAAKTGRGAKR